MNTRTIRFRILLTAALGLVLPALAAAATRADAPTDTDRAEIRAMLDASGLLADPFGAGTAPAAFGDVRVTSHLEAGEPTLEFTYGAKDDAGRPREATVIVRRWITGTLDVQHPDARGRQVVTRKVVRDSCARQVTLRRVAGTNGEPRWRVAAVSAFVRLTPAGRASLPLVDLNTHGVSSGYLSVVSDLDELAVLPQTCAVALPGDEVQVFVGGLDADAVVSVFANGQCVTAKAIDGSHAVATVKLDGTSGLRQIGVTVFPRRTLVDASARADSRTWVLPILVGNPPPASQEYFAL